MTDPVAAIARAVLYEGYVLWPYRRTALKNQKRWTWGAIHPPAHAAAHPDDPAEMRTQVLVRGDGEVDVRVRFLHVVARAPLDPSGAPVDVLEAGGERHVAWDEATEREVGPGAVVVPAGAEVEPVAGGALRRSWEELRGEVRVAEEVLRPGLRRIAVHIVNTTPFPGSGRDAAVRQSFVSCHTVLRSEAAFVSLTDPPGDLAAEAAACENLRTWPVLVGDEHTMLSSPIILPDFPQIAPESPGDFFDGAEIDGLLVLSLLSMTDEERRDMRAADPRAREILERVAAMTDEQKLALHGTIRERSVAGWT